MKEYIPAAPLQKYIHRYWIVSSIEAMPAEKCVMDGFVKLFLYLNDNLPEYVDKQGLKREWGDGIGGHQTDGDLLIRTPENLRLIFCIFKPFGFHRLFNIPIHLLNNNLVPLDIFLGKRTREFKDRVLSAPSDEEKIRTVDDFFGTLVRKMPNPCRSAVELAQDHMLQRNGLVNIDDLSRYHNISRRSLERNFSERVGMPQKYYSRVLRSVAFYSKPHPIEVVYVGRAWKNLR